MYAKFFKRVIDFVVSLVALILLLPVFIILSVIGAIAMQGNPFFTQLRPGKKGKDGKEKIFKLVKFRTMTREKDKDGKVKEGEELLELEFNSEGIITNYKQTIGAMAEELRNGNVVRIEADLW